MLDVRWLVGVTSHTLDPTESKPDVIYHPISVQEIHTWTLKHCHDAIKALTTVYLYCIS